MRKLIDIPDYALKDLKILAVKSDTDLKNYIQDLLINHYELSKVTDLALDIANDKDQIQRAIMNFLTHTYTSLKDEGMDYEYLLDEIIAGCKQLKATNEDE